MKRRGFQYLSPALESLLWQEVERALGGHTCLNCGAGISSKHGRIYCSTKCGSRAHYRRFKVRDIKAAATRKRRAA